MSDKIKATQRNATRNQSTVDFQRFNLFLWNNRYQEEIFNNNSGANLTAKAGILVSRDTANPTKIIPTTEATLANVIGILNVEGEIVLADGEDLNSNLCISGDVDSNLLVLPGAATLSTVVGNKLLKDVLTDLGFVLKNVVEESVTPN